MGVNPILEEEKVSCANAMKLAYSVSRENYYSFEQNSALKARYIAAFNEGVSCKWNEMKLFSTTLQCYGVKGKEPLTSKGILLDTYGILAFRENTVLVCPRGTEEEGTEINYYNKEQEKISAIDVKKYPNLNTFRQFFDGKDSYLQSAYVHKGVLDALHSSYDEVLEEIDSYASRKGLSMDDMKFLLTGHGLGGSISAAFVPSLKMKFQNSALYVLTYGAPTIFNATAVAAVHKEMPSEDMVNLVTRLKNKNKVYDQVVVFSQKAYGFIRAGMNVFIDVESSVGRAVPVNSIEAYETTESLIDKTAD